MKNYTETGINYPIQWLIRREPIYRLLDNNIWIENFFNNGELMLSCYNNFRKNPDEMQGDKSEGTFMITGKDCKKNHHVILGDSGLNSFVMSTTNLITDQVIRDFNAKCAIKIINPSFFAMEIARKLPFVQSGVEGKCIYVDFKSISLENEIEEYEFFNGGEIQNDLKTSIEMQKLTKGNEMFLKSNKYSHQNEYRLIWFSVMEIKESILIKCPEAIPFCEKIIF
ncbi:MAG: hypothetical protein PHH30_05060 [Bacteroidales bacterium]|nr:hypothetical protein [Bacteroidales bacterium]MDD3859301.1 hypothetical protein [Bacteroidales bacterium]